MIVGEGSRGERERERDYNTCRIASCTHVPSKLMYMYDYSEAWECKREEVNLNGRLHSALHVIFGGVTSE